MTHVRKKANLFINTAHPRIPEQPYIPKATKQSFCKTNRNLKVLSNELHYGLHHSTVLLRERKGYKGTIIYRQSLRIQKRDQLPYHQIPTYA